MEEETVKSLEKLKQLITETQDEVMNHVKNGVITVGDINYTTDLNTKVSTFTKELKSFLISIEEIWTISKEYYLDNIVKKGTTANVNRKEVTNINKNFIPLKQKEFEIKTDC